MFQLRIHEAVSDLQQYSQAQNANTSLGIRFTLWYTGLNLVAQHPLLGWGSMANYVRLSGDSAVIFQSFNHFHNELLDALVKRGLVGCLALLVIYCMPALLFYRQLKRGVESVKPLALAGLMLVFATVIFGLTQSFFSHSSGVMVYVFLLVILWAQVRSAESVSK
jgi:O-antigen ligase